MDAVYVCICCGCELKIPDQTMKVSERAIHQPREDKSFNCPYCDDMMIYKPKEQDV